MHPDWLIPDWPASAHVRAFSTTRAGGVSRPPYDSMNPASHVGDDPAAVAENRRILMADLPAEPLWLNQVHGNAVVERADGLEPPCADAAIAHEAGKVCVVMTADCLPVLFTDLAGSVVAAAHAGWRGLARGILEETVAAMKVPPEKIMVWLGPAIGPEAFEVGEEVREAFISQHRLAAVAFRPALPGTLDEVPRKWLADIYALARIRLSDIGVAQFYGGAHCTYSDPERFFSYRRDGATGRMASLIYLK
jgi:YfiH family protein